ncbi:MAG TPA: Gfo/Idh/MocA family oxidoreductase [Actinocrinis sp.]|nr:Gfo/Idh/MocA family oxidoreductase [Actinocrinis sp.]
MTRLRIGVLGAARIVPTALIKPAAGVPDVVVAGIAARDVQRARQFANEHGITTAYDSYQEVLDDPDIDAVYIPLPNSLHAPWTLKAVEAGKHVLCEKPFTANAAQARAVVAAAAGSGLVVMEAFHYRYHPLAERMREICASGELGAIESVEVSVCFPLPRFGDIRYSYPLAGGAMMDAGCYALHCLRLLAGETPDVVSARAKRHNPEIDRAITAQLRFPSGATGRISASLWSRRVLDIGARVVGERGELKVLNFVAPQVYNRLTVKSTASRRHERVRGESSYTYQLRAFADAVLRGGPVLTSAEDAVVNMSLVDEVYRAAGMRLRGGS